MLDDYRFQDARHATVATAHAPPPCAFSIVTLVTDSQAYRAMCESFAAAGFDAPDCEFLTIDNRTGPNVSAFAGLNAALAQARGHYVILCHQDVLLTHDRRGDLERCLAGLEQSDPGWAVAGNAGGCHPGRLAIRISDPHAADQASGPFPARVESLDENFIVVKGAARIGFSTDLEGFHFYGADLCAHARMAGHTSYVIDFHLTHLSPGKKDASFERARRAFVARWANALRPRLVQTTCAVVALDPNPWRAQVKTFAEHLRRYVDRRLARLMDHPRRPTAGQRPPTSAEPAER